MVFSSLRPDSLLRNWDPCVVLHCQIPFLQHSFSPDFFPTRSLCGKARLIRLISGEVTRNSLLQSGLAVRSFMKISFQRGFFPKPCTYFQLDGLGPAILSVILRHEQQRHWSTEENRLSLLTWSYWEENGWLGYKGYRITLAWV